MMTYSEARDYMEHISKKGSQLGLHNIRNLLHELSDVQEQLKIVHIAGTNGKGSTSAYISSILERAGYKVGRYSSPAVFEYLEIFSINDTHITEQEYTDIMQNIQEAVYEITASGNQEPTAFEIETALAFLYFYRNNCDIVILETGMGGTFDATNIITSPLCSVITSISMDHMEFLGNTLEEIAENKAGIIKQGCPVIIAKQQAEVLKVIQKQAQQQQAKCIQTQEPESIHYDRNGTQMNYTASSGIRFENIYTKMLGTFQTENITTAIETVLYLKETGFFIYEENILEGIAETMWKGRFEQLNLHPPIYFDGGHNPGAAFRIKETIEIYFTNSKIIYIMGVLADKDYEKVLELTAPLANEIITITPENARGLDGRELAESIKKYNTSVSYAENLECAFEKAIDSAGDDGVILVFGSLSYLAKAKESIQMGA